VENWVIIGLGNSGDKFHNTRHNLGFWFLDLLAKKQNLKFKFSKTHHAYFTFMHFNNNKIYLVKPDTFMNESGRYLSNLLSFFNCSSENVILIHDELTLPLGNLKISKNKGAGGHNGVASVISGIGNSLIRFRLGIGSKPLDQMKLSDFVLSKFSKPELSLLEDQKDSFLKAIFSIFENGLSSTMNFINQTTRSQQPL
jgi:PTH1 family peptidyl-tRNA hydrolase